MLSLGIHFSPKALIPAPVLLTIFIRMGIGLLLGFLFVAIFRLKGISREVVLIISSAPSGISTLVFSSMEDLNKEMAADVVSYSVLAGMFLVPILLGFSS
jgi:predicted permease